MLTGTAFTAYTVAWWTIDRCLHTCRYIRTYCPSRSKAKHWWYYSDPACCTETVLIKRGGGGGGGGVGGAVSIVQHCFSAAGWFGVTLPVICHINIPLSVIYNYTLVNLPLNLAPVCRLYPPYLLLLKPKVLALLVGWWAYRTSQYIHQYATMMSPNKNEAAVDLWLFSLLFGMTGKVITISSQ